MERRVIHIRQANVADAVVLAGLIADVQTLHADALPDIFKPVDDLEPFVEDCRNRLLANPDGWVYLAELDGEAVGYVYVFRNQRDATPYTWVRDTLMVDQISVRPAYQDRGVGRALMQTVCDLAKEAQIDQVGLKVLAFNDAAIGFYDNLGFTMFSHGMVLDLKDEMIS